MTPNTLPRIPLSNRPLLPYRRRIGFLFVVSDDVRGATIPVTVDHLPEGIRVSVRSGGTLGRRFLYLSKCFEASGLVDKLVNSKEKQVTL